MATSAQRTKEKHGAGIFNNAFTGDGPEGIMSGGDAEHLCDSAHPSTGSAGYTNQSNTGTTAISATAVEATRRLMAAFTDDRGNIISVNPDTIIIPRAKEEEAWTIVATKGKVNSAENNANFHYGKYKLAVWDLLSDTNNWFNLN